MRTRLVPVLVLLSLVLAACQTGQDREHPLIASAQSPIADVPVPAGFYLVGDSQWTISADGQIRSVNHHYKGKDYLLPIVAFYREQLPKNGWTLGTQTNVDGTYILNATKGRETLAVAVHEGTFDTHIRVRLDPVARGQVQP